MGNYVHSLCNILVVVFNSIEVLTLVFLFLSSLVFLSIFRISSLNVLSLFRNEQRFRLPVYWKFRLYHYPIIIALDTWHAVVEGAK